MSDTLTVEGSAALVEVSATAAAIEVGGASLVEVSATAAAIEVGGPAVLVEVATAGAQGPPGVDGDKTYVHDQVLPSTTWTVDHGLNKFPSIDVVDSGGNVVHGDVRHVSAARAVLSFNFAFGGKAFAN
jgi:hypothetical protein